MLPSTMEYKVLFYPYILIDLRIDVALSTGLCVIVSQLVLIEAPVHVTQARPPRLLEGKKDDSDGMNSGEAGELSFGPSLGFCSCFIAV